jgi:diguanylate cyclase (GGDEF)-like protein
MALHEDKIELLRKNDIFSELREYELDIIARYSEFINVPKGQPIFVHGSPAEEMYIVDKGRVGIISVESKDVDDVRIAQIASGESFGELDLLEKATRSAAAFAEEESVLLRFPAQGHKPDEIFMKHKYLSAIMLYRLMGIIAERIWRVNVLLHKKSGWLHDLHKQVMRDKTTGLYNQLFFKEDFMDLLPDLGSHAALLMIKPDNFKVINDKYGHEAGDRVLNILGIFLQSELRENDAGVRYRGDEFAAILANTDKNEAIRRAKEISATFKAIDFTNIIGSNDIRLTVSTGVAMFPDDSRASGQLVEIALKKMYHARELGGDSIIT